MHFFMGRVVLQYVKAKKSLSLIQVVTENLKKEKNFQHREEISDEYFFSLENKTKS